MKNESEVLDAKRDRLREHLLAADRLAVAFSGGVDSTYLVSAAREVLGRDRVLAVTARSPLYPRFERDQAIALAQRLDVHHVLIDSDELAVPGFDANPPDRCYLCKRQLFTEIQREALRHGFSRIADGTHAGDTSDYRPGRRAACEAGVLSPLLQAGLTKDDIRCLSRRSGLATADRQAMACLASRFPYGTPITADALRSVETVEDTLREAGLRCYRVRYHGPLCRIELAREDLSSFIGSTACDAARAAARRAGFHYVTLDLEGYRTGSMNEVLTQEIKDNP